MGKHNCEELDHSPPSSAEVKEWVELYLHFPNTPSLRDSQLKHRDNFNLTTTLVVYETNMNSILTIRWWRDWLTHRTAWTVPCS
jgi:hypothetical protein